MMETVGDALETGMNRRREEDLDIPDFDMWAGKWLIEGVGPFADLRSCVGDYHTRKQGLQRIEMLEIEADDGR